MDVFPISIFIYLFFLEADRYFYNMRRSFVIVFQTEVGKMWQLLDTLLDNAVSLAIKDQLAGCFSEC